MNILTLFTIINACNSLTTYNKRYATGVFIYRIAIFEHICTIQNIAMGNDEGGFGGWLTPEGFEDEKAKRSLMSMYARG